MLPQMMTADQVAQYLGWSPNYVRRLAREGRIPAVRLGAQWRFFADTIVEWVRQGQPPPTEQPSLFERQR